MVLLAGMAAAMEVSNEPVAIVVDYGDMQNISLKPADVLVYSEGLVEVKTVQNSQVTYAKRSMAEMMAANVPDDPLGSSPTPPNESRFKKRLDHTPPFTGTVVGKVSIVKSAENQRVIVVSDLQGDGIMQVLVRGNTAQTPDGKGAKPVVKSPPIVVRNTLPVSETEFKGASETSLSNKSQAVRSALESHFKGAIPANLRVVAETLVVE